MLLPPGRCCYLLFLNVFGRCVAIFVVTDVIATICYYGIYWDGRCYCQVVDVVTTIVIVAFGQMLLPKWLMLLPLYVIVHILADVVAKVADVIATVCDSSYFGRRCCQGG